MFQSIHTRIAILGAALVLTACGGSDTTDSAVATADMQPVGDTRPNILLIVADDLGYADLGYNGSEIPTPNIDMLAANGMLLTDFYTSMSCGPTRSMLMSGTDNHLAGVGVQVEGGSRNPLQMGNEGYMGSLNFRVASLAELMTDAGYNSYMTGKWHLGYDVEHGPHQRGFKRNFISLDGAAHLGSYGWFGPNHARYREDDELVDVDENWYTTRDYTRKMIEYIEADRDEGKPFFAWLAYTAPHWPLQAPPEAIARFDGVYDDGYEQTYLRRFASMQDLGLIPADAEPMSMDVFSPRWDDLPAEEKLAETKRMQIYAAMVSELDNYIGEIIDYLKETNQFDNTFIMFMSDNGAESSRLDLSERYQPVLNTPDYDLSYENMGAGNSYVMYGRNWATVSETAFRRHKATGFEGGIHVPAFAHFPGLVEGGTRNGGFGTVMDVLPTFLALANTVHPAMLPGALFQGREVLPPKGRSLLPMLTGETAEVHDGYTGWELNGYRSVREGDWKIVWDRAAGDDAYWMLFNLAQDPNEQVDLGTEFPDKLEAMIGLWTQYTIDSNVVYVYPE